MHQWLAARTKVMRLNVGKGKGELLNIVYYWTNEAEPFKCISVTEHSVIAICALPD